MLFNIHKSETYLSGAKNWNAWWINVDENFRKIHFRKRTFFAHILTHNMSNHSATYAYSDKMPIVDECSSLKFWPHFIRSHSFWTYSIFRHIYFIFIFIWFDKNMHGKTLRTNSAFRAFQAFRAIRVFRARRTPRSKIYEGKYEYFVWSISVRPF